MKNKLYILRMIDESLVTEHVNAFNTIVSQLLYVDIKITDQEKCISLLCYFSDSRDILDMDIGSNLTTLMKEDIVSSLRSEEMRWNNMEG